MTEEHPFAQYVRILGKGPNLSRTLTEEETLDAMRMILRDGVEPIQLGAFLCLVRVKIETPEEICGFVKACREVIQRPGDAPAVDIDWAAYAGKTRRLPWFLLSALLLARNGVRVFMHGAEDHTPGRVYARAALESLGLPAATSMADATAQLNRDNFAYMSLTHLAPKLQSLLDLKPILGLRNPIHTIARILNPFDAPAQMLGIAHTHYRELHRTSGALLGQQALAVFKGDGGEAERRPEKAALIFGLKAGQEVEEDWPACFDAQAVPPRDEALDVARLKALWKGEDTDPHAVAVVTSTAAIALKMHGRAETQEQALALAQDYWAGRDIAGLG